MKKWLLLIMVFVICLSLAPLSAFAAATLALDKTNYSAGETITVSYSGISAEMEESSAWIAIAKSGAAADEYIRNNWVYAKQGTGTVRLNAPDEVGLYEVRFYQQSDATDANLVRSASVQFTIGAMETTDWATDEIAKADALGLIPDSLREQDLSKSISRAEFAAVAVKVYENLSGTIATPSAVTTFTDTQDSEVLKAHNAGLMVGVSAMAFEPNTLLSREQAATALTRVLKRAYIPGWTFDTDEQFTLNFTRPPVFADDSLISGWAKESVYFMAANGIIKGTGGNNFTPKAITAAEQASGYAHATREVAIIIALRIVDNLKGKPIDFS